MNRNPISDWDDTPGEYDQQTSDLIDSAEWLLQHATIAADADLYEAIRYALIDGIDA